MYNIIARMFLIIAWGSLVIFGCTSGKDLRLVVIMLYMCYVTEQILHMVEY